MVTDASEVITPRDVNQIDDEHSPTDNEPKQPARKKTWLTEGILIAAVPVYVYILMLSFVIGYCDFFQIPVPFVSLNLTTMLWISYRVEVGLFFLLFVAALVYWILKSLDHQIADLILFLVPWAGLIFLQIALRFPLRNWWLSLVTIFVFIILAWRFPYSSPPSIRRILLIVVWLTISFDMAMDMGRYVAIRQRDYLVPASEPTTVVLSYFGERLVVAPFNRSTKEVEPSFWVIKTGEDPKLLLRWESVGPLHPKPEGGSFSTTASPTTPTQPQPPKSSIAETHGFVRIWGFVSKWLNSVGLALGIVGVILIFKWGPPQPSFERGVAIALEDGTRLSNGKTVAEHNEEIGSMERRYKVMSRIGLSLVGIGFALQLSAAWV